MANTPRDPSTVPAIQAPPAFSANNETEEGAIRGLLEALHGVVNSLVSRFNGLLSVGTGEHASWAGNLDGQWIKNIKYNGTDTIAIPHGLGRVPVAVLPVLTPDMLDGGADGAVWPDPALAWTQDVVYLRSDTATTRTLSVLVF